MSNKKLIRVMANVAECGSDDFSFKNCSREDRRKLKETPFKDLSVARRALGHVKRTRVETISSCMRDSGFQDPLTPRQQRDIQQRNAARSRVKEAYKQQPKLQRERDVLRLRDKRVPIEPQVGRFMPALAGAGVALVGCKLFSFLSRSDKLINDLSKVLACFKDTAKSLKRHLGKVLWALPLVMTVYYALTNFSNLSFPLVTAVVSALSAVVGPVLWKHISKFFPGGDIVSQTSFANAASKLLATAFTFSVFGKRRISANTVTEFCKRISILERSATGWDTFLQWVMSAIEVLVNAVRKVFGKERIDLFMKTHSAVKLWMRKVDSLVFSEAVAGEINGDKLDEMVTLIRDGYGFKELYRGTPMSRSVDDALAKISSALQPYLGSLNARNNFRFEPAACMLRGAPGIGKTLMAMPFCAAIMLQSGLLPQGSTFEDVAKNVWQKGTSEYWNSYSNQICLVMDDAFQSRADPSDKENEYLSIIRMVGTWSFPLNFADLASKGKVFFGSKFVFGTTNLRSIDSEAKIVLQEPEAVVRRINFPYELRVCSQYLEGNRLDYAAFERELLRCSEENVGIDAFPWHIWEVQKHDFIHGTSFGPWRPIRELISDIVLDLKRRNENHNVTKDFLHKFVKGFDVTCQSGRILRTGQFVMDFHKEFEAYISELRMGHKIVFSLAIFASASIFWYVAFKAVKAVLGLVWGFLSDLFGNKGKKTPRLQSNRPLGVKHKRVLATDLRLQSPDSTVASNVYANTYKILLRLNSGGDYVVGQICFVMSDLALQPEHFTKTIREMLQGGEIEYDSLITLRNAINSEHTITISVQHYLGLRRQTFVDDDLEFIKFVNVRAHRNVVSSFILERDVKYIGGVRGRLDVCEVDDRKNVVPANKRMVHVLSSLAYGEDLRFAGRRVRKYFSYGAPTSPGDCGAPLCLLDNSSYSGRTAIGIHVAGAVSRMTGYSTVVTQEKIKAAIDFFDVIKDDFEEDLRSRGIALQAGNELPFSTSGSFLPIGVVDRAVSISPKTSYYVTDLYGRFGDYDCFPAPLSSVYRGGVIVHPMENAVRPYSTPVRIYEQVWLSQAVHVAMKPLTMITKDYSRRIYTFEEAVLGVPQEKFRSIPRGTAAGYPYVLDVKNGKKEFFGEEQDYDLNSMKALELRGRVGYIECKAKANVRLSHVFVDFLKDELRPVAKVQAAATRLISSAPLDYTIVWRMYFGAFSSAVMRNCVLTGMAPGICVYTDWDVLVNKLCEKGPLVFDGDFKAFDSSEQPVIHNLILDYVNLWYNDGELNQRVRKVLWLDLCHSRHIGGLGRDQRHIYQWNKSLPSGHPFTTIVNSMYSLILIVSAYITLTGDSVDFWKYVSTVTYGDDNVSNVSEVVSSKFNQETVAGALEKEFDVIYTSGTKDGTLVQFLDMSEVTFLKRRFVLRDDVWLCPLELNSFLYVSYWCKNKKLENKIVLDVLEMALEELSMHDQHTWQQYAPLIQRVMLDREHVSNAPIDQMQYLSLVRSRSDNWY